MVLSGQNAISQRSSPREFLLVLHGPNLGVPQPSFSPSYYCLIALSMTYTSIETFEPIRIELEISIRLIANGPEQEPGASPSPPPKLSFICAFDLFYKGLDIRRKKSFLEDGGKIKWGRGRGGLFSYREICGTVSPRELM